MRSHLLLFLFIPVVLLAQSPPDLSVRLLQDRRSLQLDEYESYLTSDVPEMREQALLAIANGQDTSFARRAASFLADPEPRVRAMAAFAVGMTSGQGAATSLFRRLAVERDERCVSALFNALGLSGSADDLRKMILQTEDYPEEWNADVATAVYRFANRRVKDPSATKHAVRLLEDPKAFVNATYALMRINDTTVIRRNRDRLVRMMDNSSPVIRMWTASMLAADDDTVSVKRLAAAARSDKDWRVRVNAVRALRNNRSAASVLLALGADANHHVAVEAVTVYATLTAGDTLFSDSTALLRLFRSAAAAGQAKDELRKVLAQRMGERAVPLLKEWKGPTSFSSARRIAALGATRSAAVLPMLTAALAPSESSVVTIAALEAIHAIARTGTEQLQNTAMAAAAGLFSRRNAGISYSAAIVFQDTSLSAPLRRRYLPALLSEFRSMRSPADLEPMVELLNVFGSIGDSTALTLIDSAMTSRDRVIAQAARNAFVSITGAEELPDLPSSVPGYSPFFTQDDLTLLGRYSSATVTTTKGTFTIRFDKNAAPLTVLNFILLAKKGFYTGLPFHRVVANFVIQGGDPLGNGSGGPEHSIRTEVHPSAVYRTGAVGMASAGKDTEGSQWFVTHCPTPHLDFRYSIFGYTQDRSVIDRVTVGDRIIAVTLQ